MRIFAVLLLLLLFAIIFQTDATNNILVVGDSMGSYMGKTLENICPGAAIQNAAIGGTTALQWANDFNAEALDSCSNPSTYNHVYMSFGGNDLLESCSISASALEGRIKNAITNVKDTIAPGATSYVLAGYCQVRENDECVGQGPGAFTSLSTALTNLASFYSGTNVKIFNHMTVCEGDLTTYGDPSYFQDPIHLNAKGYCSYFTQTDIATALECGSQASIDCNSNPPPLCGININEDPCTGGTCPSTPNPSPAPTTTQAPTTPTPTPDDNSKSSDDSITYVYIGVGAGLLVLSGVGYVCIKRARK